MRENFLTTKTFIKILSARLKALLDRCDMLMIFVIFVLIPEAPTIETLYDLFSREFVALLLCWFSNYARGPSRVNQNIHGEKRETYMKFEIKLDRERERNEKKYVFWICSRLCVSEREEASWCRRGLGCMFTRTSQLCQKKNFARSHVMLFRFVQLENVIFRPEKLISSDHVQSFWLNSDASCWISDDFSICYPRSAERDKLKFLNQNCKYNKFRLENLENDVFCSCRMAMSTDDNMTSRSNRHEARKKKGSTPGNEIEQARVVCPHSTMCVDGGFNQVKTVGN